MAPEGRHRRPRSTAAATTHRLVLAAGVTGAGLGVPLAAAGAAAAQSADTSPGKAAEPLGDSTRAAAFTGTIRLAAPARTAPQAVHVVAPGETLSGIARSNRTPGGWRSVYLDNREVIGDDPDLIVPGQRLHLDQAPAAHRTAARTTEHVVRRGETLASIAEDAGVDGGWRSVYLDNREVIGDDPDLILPGRRLALPAPGTAAHPAKPAATRTAPEHRTPVRHTPVRRAPVRTAPVRTAPAHTTPARTTAATLPVHGYTLTAGYRDSGSHWAHRHTGQDFAVPTGTPVAAVLAGTVVSAGWGGAYGNQVVLRHRDGTYTVYAHLSSIGVHRGQTVAAGGRLGRSGATGNVTGPHLHFEVRNAPGYGSDIDPVAWLRSHGLHL